MVESQYFEYSTLKRTLHANDTRFKEKLPYFEHDLHYLHLQVEMLASLLL